MGKYIYLLVHKKSNKNPNLLSEVDKNFLCRIISFNVLYHMPRPREQNIHWGENVRSQH